MVLLTPTIEKMILFETGSAIAASIN